MRFDEINLPVKADPNVDLLLLLDLPPRNLSTPISRPGLETSLIPGTLGKGLADAHSGEKDQTKIRKGRAVE